MTTIILRTLTPLMAWLIVIVAVIILLKGHNAPGGGFIGGLILAAAVILVGFTSPRPRILRRLRVAPMSVAGVGLGLAAASGLPSRFFDLPYLTGLWAYPFGVAVSTPLLFDIGVFLVVAGVVAAVAVELQPDEITDPEPDPALDPDRP